MNSRKAGGPIGVCITRRAALRGVIATAVSAGLPGAAVADTWPSKPITFVVPYPPGGASDVFARLIAERLQVPLGQSVVVENRAGANGIIAYQHVAKASPDGHTILMANIGPSAINPSIYKKLPYDPQKDFAPVTLVSWVPLMMVVNPVLGVSTVEELIAKAKAEPGKLSFAISGVGTAGHLAMELFRTEAGLSMTAINYKGDSPALADMISNSVQVMMPTVVAGTPLVASGKLKALAVTTPKRLEALPNVPTVAESNFPGFQAVSWGGILAPAGTPKPVIDRLNAEIVTILKLPQVRDRFQSAGAQAVTSTPEEFADYIASETVKWGKVAKSARIALD